MPVSLLKKKKGTELCPYLNEDKKEFRLKIKKILEAGMFGNTPIFNTRFDTRFDEICIIKEFELSKLCSRDIATDTTIPILYESENSYNAQFQQELFIKRLDKLELKIRRLITITHTNVIFATSLAGVRNYVLCDE